VVEVPELVGRRPAAVLLLDDEDVTYARLRLDPASLHQALGALAAPVPPLARAKLTGIVWDMTRDGELPATRFVALATSWLPALAREAEVELLRVRVDEALRLYCPPQERPTLAAGAGDAAWQACGRQEPGRGLHTALVSTFVRWATTEAQLDRVASWVADPAGGPLPDPDRRWEALHALVTAGRLDADGIEAEADRDRTVAGQLGAAYARAALPSAAAKQAAWDRMTAGEVTAEVLDATVAGFADVRDPALLLPFRTAYPAMVRRAWEGLDEETAYALTEGLFPTEPVDPATLRLADRLLAEPLPDPARRLVAEGRDGVRRALAARAATASTA
jgi:aminopeptidase N